jgi:hypothetical protein
LKLINFCSKVVNMRTTLATLINLYLCVGALGGGVPRQQSPVKSAAEQEIRAALCEIDRGAYVPAQQRIERLLQTDPKNLDARKVLLGIFAEEIKPGDNSPENIALIRKAIAAYQEALNNPQFNAEERARIDKFLILLYGKISRQDLQRELERRAADENRNAKDRSSAYTVLAGESWDCSYNITDSPAVKVQTITRNLTTTVYKKPAAPEDFDRAQACVKRGLAEVESAIKLDPDNESAWSYKTNLLLEAAKLAEMEGDSTRKDDYRKQSNEAAKVTSDLATRSRAESEKEWARQEQERKNDESFTPEQAAAFSRELVEYKRENSLTEAVKNVFIPAAVELTTLVAPVPIPEEKSGSTSETTLVPPPPTAVEKSASASDTSSRPASKGCFREVDGPAQVQEKRNWKTFAPDGEEIVVELPDNVCKSSGGYLAASEGVMYSINSIPRPAMALDEAVVDGTLNTLARTFTGFRSSAWLGNGLGNSFELKLLRKEKVAGQPRKVYAYAQVSCAARKESVLVIQAARAHYYTIDINGADESDPRVQQFLASLKMR